MPWIFVPLFALMIPIIAMLTRHQQRMAEIIHQGAADHHEVNELRKEIADLKALVHQQTINIDNISAFGMTSPPPAPNIPERLSSS